MIICEERELVAVDGEFDSMMIRAVQLAHWFKGYHARLNGFPYRFKVWVGFGKTNRYRKFNIELVNVENKEDDGWFARRFHFEVVAVYYEQQWRKIKEVYPSTIGISGQDGYLSELVEFLYDYADLT